MTLAAMIAEAASGWLAEVVPPGFAISRGTATSIVLRSSETSLLLDLGKVVREEPPFRERDIRVGVDYVLSSIQDAIIEELREPWPRVPGSSAVPVPALEIEMGPIDREAIIRVGYKWLDRWILESGPIALGRS